jgi:hypothetical protein
MKANDRMYLRLQVASISQAMGAEVRMGGIFDADVQRHLQDQDGAAVHRGAISNIRKFMRLGPGFRY